MRTIRIILSGLMVVWTAGIISCSKGDNETPNNNNNNPDPQTEVRNQLTAGTWSLVSASRDDMDVSTDFNGFTMTFTSSGFSVTHGGTAFPDTGNWTFDGEDLSTIVIDGDLKVILTFSDNNQHLSLRFLIEQTDYSLGMEQQLQGSYLFELSL